MSAIHQALKKADTQQPAHVSAEFNPLNRTVNRPAGKKKWPHYLLASSLFIAALALFFWPEAQIQPLAQASAEELNATASQAITAVYAPAPELPLVANAPTEMTQSATMDIILEPATHTEPIEPATEQPDTASNLSKVLAEQVEQQTEQIEVAVKAGNQQPNRNASKPTPVEPAVSPKPEKLTATPNNPKPVIPAQAATVKVNDNRATAASNESLIRSSTTQWQLDIESFIAQDEIEQAEETLKNWISSQPKDATPRVWLAKIYLNNGFYQAAEPLIASLTNHSEAQALLGILYERTNRPALAAPIFEALFRSQPEQGKWLLFWAINSENSGELAKSATLYQNYLSIFPQDNDNLRQFAHNRLKVIRGQ